MPNLTFSNVYLITLARRPDRLAAGEQALRAEDWPFAFPEIVYGVDGAAVPAPREFGGKAGAWGCFRSHQHVVEQALMHATGHVLILEDDIETCENFAARAVEFLAAVPENWQRLLFGGWRPIPQNNGIYSPLPVNDVVMRDQWSLQTHAYAVNRAYLREYYLQLCTFARQSGKNFAFDHFLALRMRQQFVYSPREFLITQRGTDSDTR